MRGTLSELLDHSRREYAGRTAVEDPRTGASLTYSELGSRADSVAAALAAAGVKAGDRVGVCAPKSVTAVAALHGILGAGAAYVPVDSASPPARNAGIFADCQAAAIIASAELVDAISAAGFPCLEAVAGLDDGLKVVTRVRADERGDGRERSHVGPDDLAYILYTSGSTGKPKGVVHTHASARAFTDWCVETFAPSEADKFSSHAPFHFDLSILDLYVSVACGGAVVLIDDEIGKQPLRLASVIEDRKITVWYSTPSALRLLAGYGKIERHDHSSLRLVLFAGEVFPVSALRALRSQWPEPKYFNLYGPTETNVCTCFMLPDEVDARSTPYPIGHVCAGDRARVVDGSGDEVSAGEEGELLIAGPTVMREYWNLADRTLDAFADSDGERWYRTGDVVRESAADGFIFIGRRDRMVKRRGFRVELGEIEAALSLHPSVAHCAVTSSADDESGVRIEAVVVSSIGARPSVVELKQFCAGALPLYMVPDRFTFYETIPQTSTGKIDYQRLREQLL